MTTTTATAWARVEALRVRVREAEAHVASLEARRAQAARDWRQAKTAELDHLRAVEAGAHEPDPDLERELADRVAELEGRLSFQPATGPRGGRLELEPTDDRLEARLDGARAALEDRRAELARFWREEFDALAGELVAEAREAQEAVEQALPALLDAESRYRQVRARWRPLLEGNGIPYDLPPNPLRGFADEVDPFAGVPLPIPAALLG